jgi:hypothetical protein
MATATPASHTGSNGRGLGEDLRRSREEVEGIAGEVGGIAADLREIARKELQLAKAEMGESAGYAIKGIAAGAVAALMALYMIGFLCWAGFWALNNVMPSWAAALVVAGVLALIVLAAALVARSMLKKVSIVPRRLKGAIQEDTQWAKTRIKSQPTSTASASPSSHASTGSTAASARTSS